MKVVPEIVKNFLKRKICQVCKQVSSNNNIYCRKCYSTSLRSRRPLKSKK